MPLRTRLLTLMLTCYAAHAATPYLPEGDEDYFESVFFSAFQEPVSCAAAMRAPDAEQWIVAMDKEKDAFFANGTSEIVDADPPGTSFPPSGCSSSSAMSTAMSPAIEHVWSHGVSYSAREQISETFSHQWSDTAPCGLFWLWLYSSAIWFVPRHSRKQTSTHLAI